MEPEEATAKRPRIAVCAREGGRLNGLGIMLQQYLEQNLSDSEEKVRQGLRLRGRVGVEVEKGIGVTLDFLGDRILVENGIQDHPDLQLRSSYLVLSRVLSGKANPVLEFLRGNIKLLALPRRPLQSYRALRFLEIPRELVLESAASGRNRRFLRRLGAVLGAAGLALIIFLLLQRMAG
jgi:hypothetical protein